MTLGLILGVLTAATLALLLRPLIAGVAATRPRADYDAEIYRDQLAELDRDMARGVVEPDQAKAARAEIARRLLAADAASTSETAEKSAAKQSAGPGRTKAAAVALAILLPVGAGALYYGLGSPGLPGQPFAERGRGGPDKATIARLEAAARAIEAQLKKTPKDTALLGRLGRIAFILGRYTDAAATYARALKLQPGSAAFAASQGEALVFANRRVVGKAAKALFERALKAKAGDVRARFYLALAKAQAGDRDGALREWIALEAETQPEAAWRRQLASFIESTAREAGLTPTALAKLRADAGKAAQTKAAQTTGRGPGRDDMARAKRLSPDQRAAMIRGMVDGLASRLKENPNDLAGWQRLGRSYMVLREYPKAAEAWGQAARLAPKDVGVLVNYGQALLAVHGKDRDLPPNFIAVVRRIHALQPDHVIGLWFLGVAEYEAGNRDKAAALWTRLLARLPKEAAERAALAKRIEMLKMKKQ
ncbi:MAG TPA: c-type cytochrome biogenesis protein CcmI [Alphaproteobacteria bacterium]|nr:c-type cytochrome biogenesis protein CcmI [Alphaproteobacteria bacterium]